MIISIHQPQYWPWLGYFDKIDKSDVFILLDNVQFKKNEWQNRNRIRSATGWQWLTVPVMHNFGQKISEVKINNRTNWRQKHFKSIVLNYSRAPFLDDFMDLLNSLYTQQWEYLVQLNIEIILKVVEILGINTKIVRASDYMVSGSSTQRLVNLCKLFGADTYLSGASGPEYMDMSLFKENNINVIVQDYKHPVYVQVSGKAKEGFVPCMSVIDLLLNCGSKSLEILRS